MSCAVVIVKWNIHLFQGTWKVMTLQNAIENTYNNIRQEKPPVKTFSGWASASIQPIFCDFAAISSLEVLYLNLLISNTSAYWHFQSPPVSHIKAKGTLCYHSLTLWDQQHLTPWRWWRLRHDNNHKSLVAAEETLQFGLVCGNRHNWVRLRDKTVRVRVRKKIE